LVEPAPDISDIVAVANAFPTHVALTVLPRDEVALGRQHCFRSSRSIPLSAQIWAHILECPLASSIHQAQEKQGYLYHATCRRGLDVF